MSKLLNQRYQIGEMIGTGGMADVYFGEDKRLGRNVAIKILRRDLSSDPTFLARFKKEALAAAALSHPNIVSIFDAGEDQGNSFLVMELVKGITLSRYLEEHKLNPVDALNIINQILEAVKYSHQAGIVHRDIKPGNIMITSENQIKVMDFGIARLSNQDAQTITNTLNVLGTAQYISPEQATGSGSDERSDIYAIGCILYELLTGRTPFTGETPVSVAFQHVSSDVVAPSKLVKDLSLDLEKIILIALAKSQSDRYQTAADMQNDILKVLNGEKIQSTIPKTKRKNSLRNKFILATSILIIFAIGVFAFLVKSNKSTVLVPNLLGETLTQAKSFIGNFNLVVKNQPSSTTPVGKVSAQEPLPLSHASKNSTITITISTGPGSTSVPLDLVGLSLVDAENSLRSAGLQIAQTVSVNSNQTPGTIIATTPPPGSKVLAGTGITLSIASGQITVPGVIGNDKVAGSTELSNAGFLVTLEMTTDNNYPDGAIISQSPEAGSSQPIGSSVTLTVNQLTSPSNGN